jgi:NAD(P)-dependent dehydrogenase (short-subunit alcohol dehydrogenase family)
MKGFLDDHAFDGLSAVVTGGGTGLGLETARLFARLGARVAIVSRDPKHHTAFLDEATQNRWTACARVCDVREPKNVETTMGSIREELGSLDVLVNNAAGNFLRASIDLPAKGWQAVIDIALSGVFYCSQSVARIAIDDRRACAIVNIIAPYAWTGCPGVVHSVSAKAGVLALTKSLAVEWARHHIRVNAIAPGPFQSEGAAGRLWPTPEIEEAIREGIPLGRFGDAAEIARSVVYLASPLAGYITGACLTVDGGFSLGKGLDGAFEAPDVPRRPRSTPGPT